MKIFSVAVVIKRSENEAEVLKASYNLQSFGYFQRSSVKELLTFSSKIVVERSSKCSRSAVTEREYLCHVYVRQDGLAGVLISDDEYPTRVAQTCLSNLLDEFTNQYPSVSWPNLSPQEVKFGELDDNILKWQNPKDVDLLARLQDDLEETEVILKKTLEQLLNRGEKLDDLVARTEQLSLHSKTFYSTAKKTNSCCVVL